MEPAMEGSSGLSSEASSATGGGDKPSWVEGDSLPDVRSGQRPPSEEVRASLAAIQAARAAAQARLHRDSRHVRLLTAAVLAAFAAGGFALVGHFRRSRPPLGVSRAMVAPTVPLPPSPARSPSPSRAAEPAIAAGTLPGAVDSPAPIPTPAATEESTATAAARAFTQAACVDAYDAHRWRSAADSCAAAFEASPREASLAMKVAQAQHARGHYADAGAWARRAIALEGVDPEAYVILAHAERRAGNPAAARSAYRRYLSLAPRGWHASEARAVLHRSRPEARPRIASDLG